MVGTRGVHDHDARVHLRARRRLALRDARAGRTDYPNRIVFREIDPPARIVYENGWDLPGVPLDFTVVVTFAPEEEKTRFSLHMTFRDADALRAAVERYGVMHGGTQTLDRLAQYAEKSG